MEVGLFMSKSKYTQAQKIRACKLYLSGEKAASEIALEMGMSPNGRNVIREWAKVYQSQGLKAFEEKIQNQSYTKEFKLKVVQEYLSGKVGVQALMVKYNISSTSVLRQWIKRYNNHMVLKDYDPKPEVYMTDTLKTTYEERIKIVKDCLDHNRDIKGTAEKYGCKYAQLYQWIRKYEADGQDALIDKRGKRKQDEELSELEKAKRKIAQLEREKEEYRKKYELLKKAEKRERW